MTFWESLLEILTGKKQPAQASKKSKKILEDYIMNNPPIPATDAYLQTMGMTGALGKTKAGRLATQQAGVSLQTLGGSQPVKKQKVTQEAPLTVRQKIKKKYPFIGWQK